MECPTGKVRHASPEAAERARWRMNARGRDGVLSSYRCEHCGGYHVGHYKGNKQTGKVQR